MLRHKFNFLFILLLLSSLAPCSVIAATDKESPIFHSLWQEVYGVAAVVEPEPEPKIEPKVGPKVGPKLEPKLEPKKIRPKSKSEAEADTEPEVEPEVEKEFIPDSDEADYDIDEDAPVIKKGNAKKVTVSIGKKNQEKESVIAKGKVNEKDEYRSFSQEMHAKSMNSYKEWKSEVNKSYDQWKKARNDFLKRVKEYKNGLATIPLDSKTKLQMNLGSSLEKSFNKKTDPSNAKSKKQQSSVPGSGDYKFHIVDKAFSVPMRDQKRRSTCSAFAGIRAIEILLAQQGKSEALSPEYFYWLSRPDCQKNPCTVRGSWVVPGFEGSKDSSSFDIPSEQDCPYDETPSDSNETHTPLSGTCKSKGKVGVAAYSYVTSLEELVAALDKNYPVIAGFSLSENFYQTEGVVLAAESASSASASKLDQHAKGHAILIVGYMEIPRNSESIERSREGARCFVIANSWGEGYGKGGHACLTEGWMRAHILQNPMVALTALK
ncbi:MAG: C1 family peptidase [Oligoflexia bacterium]|nr:C1 family peptidase [Oligoflexia bacterium]MBF0365501.1 C1 family peptidase [Oligoflexia bacterium]